MESGDDKRGREATNVDEHDQKKRGVKNGDRMSGRTYGTNQYLDDSIRRGKPKGGGDPGGPGGSEFGRGAAKTSANRAFTHGLDLSP